MFSSHALTMLPGGFAAGRIKANYELCIYMGTFASRKSQAQSPADPGRRRESRFACMPLAPRPALEAVRSRSASHRSGRHARRNLGKGRFGAIARSCPRLDLRRKETAYFRMPARSMASRIAFLVASLGVTIGRRTSSLHRPSSESPYFAPASPGSMKIEM